MIAVLSACSGSSALDAAAGVDATPGVDAFGGAPDALPGVDASTPLDSGTPSDGATGLAALSDQFEGSALDPSWTVLHGDTVQITEHGGALYVQPNQSILWFQACEAVQIFKSVSGDFKATALVHARKASDPTMPPDKTIHLGGVMARNPAAPPENYAFIVVGHQMNGLAVETKSTTNSASDYVGPSWPSGDAELRLCRVGSKILLYKRPPMTTTWQMAIEYDRADLPATLAVGPNVYAYTGSSGACADNNGPPDLVVSFDYFDFADVADVSACTTD
jgi:hypothetical protein